jgi:hypothetical protein
MKIVNLIYALKIDHAVQCSVEKDMVNGFPYESTNKHS